MLPRQPQYSTVGDVVESDLMATLLHGVNEDLWPYLTTRQEEAPPCPVCVCPDVRVCVADGETKVRGLEDIILRDLKPLLWAALIHNGGSLAPARAVLSAVLDGCSQTFVSDILADISTSEDLVDLFCDVASSASKDILQVAARWVLPGGEPLLHYAIRRPNASGLVPRLIGCSSLCRARDVQSCVAAALVHGRHELLPILLPRRLFHHIYQGTTALHAAIVRRMDTRWIIGEMLSHGADVNLVDALGHSPLLFGVTTTLASETEYRVRVTAYLLATQRVAFEDRPGVDHRAVISNQMALHECLDRGYVAEAHALISSGAPLSHPIDTELPAVLRILSSSHFSEEHKTKLMSLIGTRGGRESLCAAGETHPLVMRGRTAVHLAAASLSSPEVLLQLLKNSPRCCALRDQWGQTPLHLAILRSLDIQTNSVSSDGIHDATVALILDAASAGLVPHLDVFSADADGNTVLHLMCRAPMRFATCLEYMAAAVPSMVALARNKCGETPLHVALGAPPAALEEVEALRLCRLLMRAAHPSTLSNVHMPATGEALNVVQRCIQRGFVSCVEYILSAVSRYPPELIMATFERALLFSRPGSLPSKNATSPPNAAEKEAACRLCCALLAGGVNSLTSSVLTTGERVLTVAAACCYAPVVEAMLKCAVDNDGSSRLLEDVDECGSDAIAVLLTQSGSYARYFPFAPLSFERQQAVLAVLEVFARKSPPRTWLKCRTMPCALSSSHPILSESGLSALALAARSANVGVVLATHYIVAKAMESRSNRRGSRPDAASLIPPPSDDFVVLLSKPPPRKLSSFLSLVITGANEAPSSSGNLTSQNLEEDFHKFYAALPIVQLCHGMLAADPSLMTSNTVAQCDALATSLIAGMVDSSSDNTRPFFSPRLAFDVSSALIRAGCVLALRVFLKSLPGALGLRFEDPVSGNLAHVALMDTVVGPWVEPQRERIAELLIGGNELFPVNTILPLCGGAVLHVILKRGFLSAFSCLLAREDLDVNLECDGTPPPVSCLLAAAPKLPTATVEFFFEALMGTGRVDIASIERHSGNIFIAVIPIRSATLCRRAAALYMGSRRSYASSIPSHSTLLLETIKQLHREARLYPDTDAMKEILSIALSCGDATDIARCGTVEHGLTPILLACQCANPSLISALFKLHAPPEMIAGDGSTALHLIASASCSSPELHKCMAVVLAHCPSVPIGKCDAFGESVLHLCARRGFVSQIAHFLDNYTDINVNALSHAQLTFVDLLLMSPGMWDASASQVERIVRIALRKGYRPPPSSTFLGLIFELPYTEIMNLVPQLLESIPTSSARREVFLIKIREEPLLGIAIRRLHETTALLIQSLKRRSARDEESGGRPFPELELRRTLASTVASLVGHVDFTDPYNMMSELATASVKLMLVDVLRAAIGRSSCSLDALRALLQVIAEPATDAEVIMTPTGPSMKQSEGSSVLRREVLREMLPLVAASAIDTTSTDDADAGTQQQLLRDELVCCCRTIKREMEARLLIELLLLLPVSILLGQLLTPTLTGMVLRKMCDILSQEAAESALAPLVARLYSRGGELAWAVDSVVDAGSGKPILALLVELGFWTIAEQVVQHMPHALLAPRGGHHRGSGLTALHDIIDMVVLGNMSESDAAAIVRRLVRCSSLEDAKMIVVGETDPQKPTETLLQFALDHTLFKIADALLASSNVLHDADITTALRALSRVTAAVNPVVHETTAEDEASVWEQHSPPRIGHEASERSLRCSPLEEAYLTFLDSADLSDLRARTDQSSFEWLETLLSVSSVALFHAVMQRVYPLSSNPGSPSRNAAAHSFIGLERSAPPHDSHLVIPRSRSSLIRSNHSGRASSSDASPARHYPSHDGWADILLAYVDRHRRNVMHIALDASLPYNGDDCTLRNAHADELGVELLVLVSKKTGLIPWLELRDESGDSALLRAARRACPKTLAMLLKCGASPFAVNANTKESCMHAAFTLLTTSPGAVKQSERRRAVECCLLQLAKQLAASSTATDLRDLLCVRAGALDATPLELAALFGLESVFERILKLHKLLGRNLQQAEMERLLYHALEHPLAVDPSAKQAVVAQIVAACPPHILDTIPLDFLKRNPNSLALFQVMRHHHFIRVASLLEALLPSLEGGDHHRQHMSLDTLHAVVRDYPQRDALLEHSVCVRHTFFRAVERSVSSAVTSPFADRDTVSLALRIMDPLTRFHWARNVLKGAPLEPIRVMALQATALPELCVHWMAMAFVKGADLSLVPESTLRSVEAATSAASSSSSDPLLPLPALQLRSFLARCCTVPSLQLALRRGLIKVDVRFGEILTLTRARSYASLTPLAPVVGRLPDHTVGQLLLEFRVPLSTLSVCMVTKPNQGIKQPPRTPLNDTPLHLIVLGHSELSSGLVEGIDDGADDVMNLFKRRALEYCEDRREALCLVALRRPRWTAAAQKIVLERLVLARPSAPPMSEVSTPHPQRSTSTTLLRRALTATTCIIPPRPPETRPSPR